jgi:O-antigen/teichoic acid export membrane protein
VGAVVNAGAGFLLTLIVSRYLGPSEAGVFAVLVSTYMILLVSGKLGADTALVHTLPRLLDDQRAGDVRSATSAALGPVLVVNSVAAAAVIVLAPRMADVLLPTTDPAVAVPGIIVMACALPLGTATLILLAATRGLGRIVALVTIENILKPALRCVLVLVVLAAGYGVTAAVVAWAAPALLGLVAAAWAYRRAAPATEGTPDRAALRTRIWGFARPRAGAAVLEILGLHVGVLLLSALATSADAGVFNAAARVVMLGTLLQNSLRLVVAPQVSRLLGRGATAEVERLHRVSAVWIVLASWPFYACLVLWPGAVMSMFGAGFEQGATALAILAVGMMVNLATGNVMVVVLMSGHSRVNLWITIISVAANTALCILLIPAMGTVGAAIARTTAVVFENLAAAVFVRRSLGVRTVSSPLIHAAALSVFAYAVPALALHLAGYDSLPAVVGQVLVSTLLYGVGIVVLRRTFGLNKLGALVGSRRRGSSQHPEETEA